MLKVLIVVDTMGTGGKERRLLELLKGLAQESSLEVCLIILSDIVEYEELHRLPIPVQRIRRRHKKDLSLVCRVQRMVRQLNPHIIQRS